jgi:hypothetical protein
VQSGARGDPLDPAVGEVGHVVERRHVDATGPGQPEQQLVPAHPDAPTPSSPVTMSVIVRTACSPSPITAASMKSAIGSGLNAAWPPR